MSRLVIISNRLPITISHNNGAKEYKASAGGLATGLGSLDDTYEKLWIGWPGTDIEDKEEQAEVRKKLLAEKLVPVFLTEEEIDLYYGGFSNKTIWPHFHYFTQYTTYRDTYWQAYKEVNRKFAEACIDQLEEDDLVWVHDYQLMLLPQMIRKAFPDISIGFFLHIPFPSYEVFRVLPWREEILAGILGADLIGFHTFDYMRHFLSAVYRIGKQDHQFGKLKIGKRIVNVDVFSMGINYEKYAFPNNTITKEDSSWEISELAGRSKLIVSIDRLDYSKGIPERLKAYALFLEQYPEWHRRVTLVMIVVPSRDTVDQYSQLRKEIDTLVGRINAKYSTFDWAPIQYHYRSLNANELATIYQAADIALVTPLRDGMNLVAKEYVASKETSKHGVLILSEMAGAFSELFEWTLNVNPFDREQVVEAIVRALQMPPEEQSERLTAMQEGLKKNNVQRWAATFIKEQKKLKEMKREQGTLRLLDNEPLLDAYRQAEQRLIMLDYDGTLMDFHTDPRAVIPEEEVIKLLSTLVRDKGNRIVVNSGRDKGTLEKWLGHLPIDMAAEHGVWIKHDGQWKLNPNVTSAWKKEVRNVLETLVERTPGSFIEEKDYSLAWHYRKIDRDFGEKRVREFRDMLLYLTHNLDLQVLEGNKVVEIKNAGVNKGKATHNWLNGRTWDFILALGDDETDEDIFRAMPEDAYTIKVGPLPTVARYSLNSVQHVRELLHSLTKVAKKEASMDQD